MTAKNGKHPATSLGRTMQRDRLAHGWTLRELSARTKTHIGTLSQVENGIRPMTENLALACDECFPERRGWYLQYYEESKDWMPSGFRDWSEYEDRARELLVWAPGIVDGLAQTEDYARELLDIYPGVTADMVETRLKSRMARQQRLLREGGPAVVLLVDMIALYRGIGSPEVMAVQCAKLVEVSKLDTVTLQVVPPVKIPLATASLMMADDAAYAENALSGSVYTEDETVTRLRRLIGSVRGEARPVSESLALIRKAERSWTGASRHSVATADRHASK